VRAFESVLSTGSIQKLSFSAGVDSSANSEVLLLDEIRFGVREREVKGTLDMRRNNRWMAAGMAFLFAFAPVGLATADDADNMDGDQLSDTQVLASENALEGSGSQASLVGGSANTGSGDQTNESNDSSFWEGMFDANAGSGSQISGSHNSNVGNRDSSDVLIAVGTTAAVSNSDLGAAVSGNMVDVDSGTATSKLGLAGEGSGFSGLFGVNAVAASAGADSSQNVSVNVGAEVMAY